MKAQYTNDTKTLVSVILEDADESLYGETGPSTMYLSAEQSAEFKKSGVDILDPAPSAPTVLVVPKLELYRRMTDEEYEQMQAGVASQSKRIQDIFTRVENFRSDDTLWPLLVQMGDQLYGPERREALLKSV
jgi:hypothetical protein